MHSSQRGERGAALLLVIMALILVTAIGLAMLFASDTETAIAANYRDKQVAMYASQAGLQEARDRINPARKDEEYFIGQPDGLASAGGGTAGNVIYIVNPASASEDINPWDPNSPYYDYNLCSTVPSLCSGTPLRPKTTSGYKIYNNLANTKPDGSSFTNPYHLATSGTYTPLKYKWVRIILKADNSTPVHVNGSNTGTKQVCWDDGHKAQILKPDTYDTDCTSAGGSVMSITLTANGSGYDDKNVPKVVIGPPPAGGTQATATAVVTSVPTDQVGSVTVKHAGSGYKVTPTVTIDPPPNILSGGVQATATATIANGGAPLTAVSLATKGGCYQNPTPLPLVNITGGGGTGATATSTMATTKSCVFAWTASGTCSAQKGKTLTVTGSGGFSGKITFKNGTGSVTGTSVTDPGTGISAAPTPLSGLSGCTITPSFTLGYQVASVAMTSGGNGYTTAPTVTLTAPGVGAQPTGTATLGSGANDGRILSITVTNPGSGYTANPNVTITAAAGDTGSGADGEAHLKTSGQVTQISMSNFGAGYVTSPTVTIDPPPGSPGNMPATATANLNPGDYYGSVYLLTSFARAVGGSVAMSEMEIANLWPPPFVSNFYKVPGAMTLAGPNPQFSPPNAMNMVISGNDANSCGSNPGEVSLGAKPALGVYDDPNNPPIPPAQTAVQSVTNAVSSGGAKPQNYQGINPTADVHNVYSSVGDPTTASAGLQAEVDAIAQYPNANVFGDPNASAVSVNGCSGTVSVGGCVPMGTTGNDRTNVVYGNLTVGPISGSGILVVTGTLNMHGDFNYSGVILVIGDGKVVWNGGGHGQITGAVYVANIHGGSGQLLAPDADWTGGGGNGIQYDHCRADNLLKPISAVPRPLNLPMLVLSTRSIGNQ